MPTYSAILLAGGLGKRLGNSTPKQYLKLKDKPIAFYSLDVFSSFAEFEQIVVVCQPEHKNLFLEQKQDLLFATPGPLRQDSVKSGLDALVEPSDFVVIHDTARPFIQTSALKKLLIEGAKVGAATLGHKITSTVKETSKEDLVIKTHKKNYLWDIQTPQLVKTSLLKEGFQKIAKENITVTDDVSIAELLNNPVKIIENTSLNFKITTPQDFEYAKYLIKQEAFFG